MTPTIPLAASHGLPLVPSGKPPQANLSCLADCLVAQFLHVTAVPAAAG